MNTGIAIIVAFLVLVVLLAFPTRARLTRAFTPARGPHPLIRPFIALARRRRRRVERRRRKHLRPL
jgi:hypothetical protein